MFIYINLYLQIVLLPWFPQDQPLNPLACPDFRRGQCQPPACNAFLLQNLWQLVPPSPIQSCPEQDSAVRLGWETFPSAAKKIKLM